MTGVDAADPRRDVCPSCSTRLRLFPDDSREVSFRCPDCETQLVVRASNRGAVRIELADARIDSEPARRLRESLNSLAALGLESVITRRVVATLLALLILIWGSSSIRSLSDRTASQQELVSAVPGEAMPEVDFVAVSKPRPESSMRAKPEVEAPVAHSPDEGMVNAPLVSEEAVEIEPVAATPPANPVRQVSAEAGEESVGTVAGPVENPVAAVHETPEPLTVRERLSIAITRFELPKPVPFRTIVSLVENLGNVQIDTTGVDDEFLNQPLKVSLNETTPWEILQGSASRVGLTVHISDEALSLVSGDAQTQ